MTLSRAATDAWATGRGIELTWAESLPRGSDFRDNPTIDFGRCIERVPEAMLAPRDEEQLAACFLHLRESGTRYALRGSGHSSGGQALIEGGVVIDLHHLRGIVTDHPDSESITVRASTQWITLCEHLAPQGRRPLCLTTNAYSAIGGTLAVGGFGDTTHLHGLQTAGVLALTLVTPDGQRHVVGPDDELFRYALAGRGQLGAITEVTLRTLHAPSMLAVRRFEWATLDQFLRDALVMTALRTYEFMRVRVFWSETNAIHGLCGRFAAELPSEHDPSIALLKASEWSLFGQTDLLAQLATDVSDGWGYACPAVEFVMPLPEMLHHWNVINLQLHLSGLIKYLRHGAALMLVPRQELPLAPVPDAPYSVMIAIRPMVEAAEVPAIVGAMRDLAALAIDLGGRLYMMSVDPDRDRIQRQFGPAWSRWLELKRAVDPAGLCNPGLLVA